MQVTTQTLSCFLMAFVFFTMAAYINRLQDSTENRIEVFIAVLSYTQQYTFEPRNWNVAMLYCSYSSFEFNPDKKPLMTKRCYDTNY